MVSAKRFEEVYRSCCQACGAEPCPQVIKTAEEYLAESDEESKDESQGGSELVLHLVGHSLELFKKRLENADVQALAAAVKECGVFVRSLDLSCNNLDDHAADFIVDILLTGQVTHLNLSSNNLGPEGLGAILEAIGSGRCSLTELVLNANPLESQGGMLLADLLGTDETLERVEIGSTGQDTDSLIYLISKLRQNQCIQVLNLDNPKTFSLDDEITMHLAAMLEGNQSITDLSVAKHRIRCSGAHILADSLRKNRTLRRLRLRCNEISVKGAQALASLLLSHGNSLTLLDLEGNRIADEGASAIGASLEFTKSLKHLNLRKNSICDTGLADLGRGLSVNVSISSVKLWGNHFGPESSKIFLDLASGRFMHYEVNLDFEPYPDDRDPNTVYIAQLE